MHTTMVPEQVKTQKIQAGVQVSRQEDTNVIFSIGSTMKDFILFVFVLVRNIGFRQKSEIKYFDIYVLVACIGTIRLLIALTSIHNLVIHQMDVKTIFLNGKLDEEVNMNQPRGFIMPGNKNKVDLAKEFLSSRFSMKDTGEADVTLGKLSRYTSNLSTQHCNAENNSSTSDWVFLLGGATGKEVEWLKNLLLEIPLWSKPIASVSFRFDSATTLAKAYSQTYNRKYGHLGVRHSMIRTYHEWGDFYKVCKDAENVAGMPYHVPETPRKAKTSGNAWDTSPGKVETFLPLGYADPYLGKVWGNVFVPKNHVPMLKWKTSYVKRKAKPERDSSMTTAPTPSKLSSLFCGTQDKCKACNKTVYPLEK
nr:zinc finger, CCHC-type [Tanacetum cinerariifolium]